MTRRVFEPTVDYSDYALPIELGGTGAVTAPTAAAKLGLVTNSAKGQANGPIALDAQGLVPVSQLPTVAGVNAVNIQANFTIITGTTVPMVITDYDSFKTYTITFSAGTFTRSGDTISYTAPAGAQAVTMTINGRTINFNVALPCPDTPTISVPANAATGVAPVVNVVASAFVALGGSFTHQSSDWQLATDTGFTNVVLQSINDTTNKTTWTFNPPNPSTTYYLRVRYKGSNGNYGSYSPTVYFTTRSSFMPVNQESIVTVNSTAVQDNASSSISISADGLRVAVIQRVGSSDTGNLYIFSRSSGSWVQEYTQAFVDKAGITGTSPNAVSISSDGSRLAVGCAGTYSGGLASAGAVHVYSRSGTTWSLEQSILSPIASQNVYFGQSVSLDSAGSRMAVGTRDGSGSSIGAVHIYVRSGTTWTQEQKITNGAVSNMYFGERVVISGDGARFAARKPGEDKVYIYSRSGSVWSQESSVSTSTNGATDMANDLALANDGSRLAVGCQSASSGGGTLNAGAVKVFSRSGTTWSLEATLADAGALASDRLGTYLSMSSDGSVIAAQAPLSGNVGAVYLFKRTGTSWAQQGSRMQETSPYTATKYGYGLSLRPDGFQLVASSSTSTATKRAVFYSYN